jgi:hypothetical protein
MAAAISRAMRAFLLKGGALGEVEDDLELRLVVEGQHLDLHGADADEAHRADGGSGDHEQENPAQAAVGEQRAHHALVNAGEGVFGNRFVGGLGVRRRAGHRQRPRVGGVLFRVVTAQHAQAAHGVTANATSSEKSIAALEPIGIGRM